MPLTKRDRAFLAGIDRLKLYVVLLAGAVFAYLFFSPRAEIQMATSIVGLALCAVFWLTQRLLSFIAYLDHELTRLTNVIQHTLTDQQRKEFFGS
jgi:hypothetical protein